jgi:flagellar basal-body rod protein FlgC
MGLSSVAAIAFSAMQTQSNNLSATADNIANADTTGYRAQGDVQPSGEGVDLAAQMVELTEEELAYRASAAAFETGADLWDILNVVTRD